MTDTTQQATVDLPLKGEKQPTFKIAAVMVLLILAVAANYFFFKPSKKAADKKEHETYDLSYAKQNPISQVAVNNHPVEVTHTEVSAEAELAKKLQEAKAKDFIERLQAPQSGSGGGMSSESGMASAPVAQVNRGESGLQETMDARITDPNTAFLVQASNSKAPHVYATHFGPLPYVIGQGKFIFANLAVAINSDLPGQITATISQDIYGEQGRKVLIPRGSLLIGEYKSGLVNNQSRLFVVWTRVREPNGIDVMLGSEGTDALGRAGLTGDVDNHFFARFGSAFLIAMIGAGASTVGVNPNDQFNSAAAYRQSVSQAMAQQANNSLNQNINIPPTINVAQGQKIVVFVNRDVDFSRVVQ